jgi:acetyl esterase/lipase
MPWFFFVLSALMALCVAHALWPLRRPWWLKLLSFNLGWMVNELPLHALAGNATMVVIFTSRGALDARPGWVALGLTAASSVGLVVLAAAHRRAGTAVDTALRDALGDDVPPFGAPDRRGEPPLPRSWLVVPWLAWWPTPGVERVANVVYSTVAGRDLKLDVYRPAAHPDNCPVLVEIHGGGWITGDRRFEARPLMARMAARGWVCVSIDYRLGRRATWPDHIVDVNTALAWVREHVADYGGDPGFVAVTGGSAGGHLAALATLTQDDPEFHPIWGTPARIRACVPFYGAYDFDNSLGLRPPGEQSFVERLVVKVPMADAPAVYAHASALKRVNDDAPPFLVIQGTSDNLVFPAESRALVSRLRAVSKAPTAYAEIPRAQHEFDALPSVRTAHVVSGVERFLRHVHAGHVHSGHVDTTAARDSTLG